MNTYTKVQNYSRALLNKYTIIVTNEYGSDLYTFYSNKPPKIVSEIVNDYHDGGTEAIALCAILGYTFEPDKGEHITLYQDDEQAIPIILIETDA